MVGRISSLEGVVVFEQLLPLNHGSVDTSVTMRWSPEYVQDDIVGSLKAVRLQLVNDHIEHFIADIEPRGAISLLFAELYFDPDVGDVDVIFVVIMKLDLNPVFGGVCIHAEQLAILHKQSR